MILRSSLSLCILLAMASLATAEETTSIQFTAPVTCEAEGKSIDLPPGRFLLESDWLIYNTELVEAQDDVTRLTAERRSLVASGGETDWRLVAAATVLGMALGGYVYRKAAQ